LIFKQEASDIDTLPNRVIPIDIQIKTEKGIVTSGRRYLAPAVEQETCSSITEYIDMTAKERAEHITLLVDENDILEILSNPARIKVASDGGFNPSSGISSYGWVIAFNRILIAKGS
jgi:hypothetical protein